MATQPTLEIEGIKIENVMEIRYSIRSDVDRDGMPTHGLHVDGITVRRVADSSTVVAEWASSAGGINRKSGKIGFIDNDRQDMKELEWSNGYVRDYMVEFVEDGEHVEEVFTIQPEKIAVGGIEMTSNWGDK